MHVVLLGYLITAAIGFAIGGVAMSGYFLCTGKPLGFALPDGGKPQLIPLHMLVRVLAGPAILVRNVFTMEDDSFGLTVAGVAIAALWSLGCGALVVQAFTSA